PDPELYLTAVQRLNYSPAHCLAIEDSANGATGAMNAGLDVIINTNEMTEAQDFSAITFVGKDLSFEQIKNRFFEPNKE
ncbi:MAG: HAD-IA family hydrolase, partial [Staphylococcus sp.]|nr:HAD-IA family hydrolase [Staphylococcus sp.]